MLTSAVGAVLRWSILIGLLALFALSIFSHFPVAHSKYSYLNEKCKVYFNFTHRDEETKHTIPNLYKIFDSCLNETVKNPIGLNMTKIEELDCYAKCYQLALGVTNQDGTFNPKFLDMVKEEYTKYSNATGFFIKKVVSLLSGCAKEAAEKYKSLEDAKEVDSTSCKMNGLYEECWNKVYWAQVNNATVQELCGDQQQ